MGGASRQMHAKKKKQEKEAAEAAKKAEEEVKVKFNKNLKWPKMYLSCWKINILLINIPESLRWVTWAQAKF